MQNLQDLHCRMLTFQFMINVEKKNCGNNKGKFRELPE